MEIRGKYCGFRIFFSPRKRYAANFSGSKEKRGGPQKKLRATPLYISLSRFSHACGFASPKWEFSPAHPPLLPRRLRRGGGANQNQYTSSTIPRSLTMRRRLIRP